MNNKFYFNYSQQNADEQIIDLSKPEGVLVINRNDEEAETKLMVANHKLIELITTYKTIRNDLNFDSKSKNIIIEQIIEILEKVDKINYSSFCVYLQVFGYSFSSYIDDKRTMTLAEKIDVVKTFVNLYIDNRHGLYTYHGYSDQVLQVNADSASSRRKGKIGITKMEGALTPLGFKKAKSHYDFINSDLCYMLPDKGDIKNFNLILKNSGIKFVFRDSRDSRDNKSPDMLIKIFNDFYIIEHKLTNGGGGSQNSEINEIIQFINQSEDLDNWHYISCLQGNFFRRLNENNKEPKVVRQLNNIIQNLENNSRNYFVNGKGFSKLMNDLVVERKGAIKNCLG